MHTYIIDKLNILFLLPKKTTCINEIFAAKEYAQLIQ
jgi:hypothetical protein